MNGFVKDDGTSSLYLCIIINKRKKLLPLNIAWLPQFFDKKSGQILSVNKNDQQASDYNLIIANALSKANDIFIYYRLSGQPLTIEKFIRDYRNDLSKTDFIKYYSEKVKLRKMDKEIVESTYENHIKTLTKLKLFATSIPFADLDENWAGSFDSWLKKNIKPKTKGGDTNNIRWVHHKNVKTYLKIAVNKDYVKLVDPYKYFKISPKPGSWKAIYEKDLLKLWQYYDDFTNDGKYRLAVRCFLFMAYTGLRISDLRQVTIQWLKDGELNFVQQKNKRYGKVIEVPLSRDALRLWNDQIAETTKMYIFRHAAEQTTNEYLAHVAKVLEIDSPIHHHIGRHTFITLLLKNGASLDMTSKYAGHATVGQTMKYNHPDEERRKKEIMVLDGIKTD